VSDPASLDNLHDIAVPAAPPLWPPAPGAWVALVVVVAAALALVLWWRAVRARSAYRRAGLDLLAEARTARDVNVALKRVALAVFPRARVASLYGADWAAFLASTCSRASFETIAASDPFDEASRELRDLAGTWIRQHRAPSGRR
jgi:hypothetical protein